MPTIIVRHKVGDIETWKKGHQDRQNVFGPAINSFQSYQDADNPNSVVLVVDAIDVQKLAEIINDPKHAGLKAKHTVLEPLTISMPLDL